MKLKTKVGDLSSKLKGGEGKIPQKLAKALATAKTPFDLMCILQEEVLGEILKKARQLG
jgi:hypothetical protein